MEDSNNFETSENNNKIKEKKNKYLSPKKNIKEESKEKVNSVKKKDKNKNEKQITNKEEENSLNNTNTNIQNDINKSNIKLVDPYSIVYNSKFINMSKINDYNGLCDELKLLEIQLNVEDRIKNNNYLNFEEELKTDISMMGKSELNDFGYNFNNIQEIFDIIKKVKKSPERRNMIDLLKIVKYLTTTNLGKYFKKEIEQKEIFEKIITFCGVEMRYKFFKKGDTIFKIGEQPDNFYMILYGKVNILKPLSKTVLYSGYQYFCYLMELKKSKENYLFDLCIKENKSVFYIHKEESNLLNYIYLLIKVEQIVKSLPVDFKNVLNITGITCQELNLDISEISNNKYILENIKKIRNKFHDITIKMLHKYLFLDEKYDKKEVTIYEYFKFLTFESKEYFGDSAMDSKTTRNATVVAEEDTYVSYINNNLYYKNVVVEKIAVINRKIRFLNSNFIFGKINPKTFEKKYYAWFICNNYKKGDILFNEGDLPYYVYFIEEGDVELYSSKSIKEFQNVIEYLEKERNNFLKEKNIEHNNKEDNELIYNKINFKCSELKEQINKKEKKKILLLKNKEDIGILSFYYGYPYLTSCIVSSQFAKIYKIDNKYLSEMLLKEKQCYSDLVNRIENKLTLFHERFFNINNTNLLLADHKKLIEEKEKEEDYLSNREFHDNINNILNNENNNNSINNNNKKIFLIKNNFNKNNLKINYFKLKEIFNKTSYINKNNDLNSTNTGSRINNNSLNNLPIIKSKKLYQIYNYNNYLDNLISSKNDDFEDLKRQEKINSKLNLLLVKKDTKKKINLKKIGIIDNKEKNNYYNNRNIFNNRNSFFLSQTNCSINPTLKKNFSSNDNIKSISNNRKNKSKRDNINISKKESNDESMTTTNSNAKKYNNTQIILNNIKSLRNNNNYDSYKSFSVSKTERNNEVYNSKEEENSNNMKNNKSKIINITINDDNLNKKKIKNQNSFNHPYYTPLVMAKKEKYKIFNEGGYLQEKLKNEKRRKELNKLKGLNEFGYPLEYIKKFSESPTFRNSNSKKKNKILNLKEINEQKEKL